MTIYQGPLAMWPDFSADHTKRIAYYNGLGWVLDELGTRGASGYTLRVEDALQWVAHGMLP